MSLLRKKRFPTPMKRKNREKRDDCRFKGRILTSDAAKRKTLKPEKGRKPKESNTLA